MTYTFRLIMELQHRPYMVFEVCKWENEKEPIAIYEVRCMPRSKNCNCFAKGNCKHIELVEEIIANGLENKMFHYMWDHDNTWQMVEDMEYA